MRYYARMIWIPIFGGLLSAQSWMGASWQGFTHVKSGIVIFCLGCIGLIVARPWLEVEDCDCGACK